MHHFNIRKRIHQKHEKFPSNNKKVRILDRIIYVAGVLGPIMTLPQIIKIYFFKDASGISLITYLLFAIFSGVWLIYGIVHREKPIIISNILWVIFDIIVVIETIIYGHGFF